MNAPSRRVAPRLAALAFLAFAACSGGAEAGYAPLPSEGSPVPGPSILQFTSSVDASHSHRVTLSASELASPPVGGIARQTTRTFGHFHRVSLTEVELRAIHSGRTVVKETTSSDGHSHRFTFRIR